MIPADFSFISSARIAATSTRCLKREKSRDETRVGSHFSVTTAGSESSDSPLKHEFDREEEKSLQRASLMERRDFAAPRARL